jgi:hypothetical protein
VGSLLSARQRIDCADPSIGPGGLPTLTHGGGAPISRVGSARSWSAGGIEQGRETHKCPLTRRRGEE